MRTLHSAVVVLASLLAFGCASTQKPATPTSAIAAAAGGAQPGMARATSHEDAALIPRATLFGNPEKTFPQLSPAGTRLSFLAPVDGVLNVWVGPADDLKAAKPVTQEKTRNIRRYFWSYGGTHVLYLQDQGGDENWHLFAVDLASGATRDLTPMPKVAAQPVHSSPKFPDEILVGLNDRDPKNHDLWRINVRTGDRKLIFKNDKGYAGILADDDFKPRLAVRMLPAGGSEYVDLTQPKTKKPFLSIPQEDSLTTEVLGFDDTGKTLFLLDSRERNTAALFSMALPARTATLLAEDPRADVQHVITHPRTHAIQAAASVYERVEWQILDKSIARDIDYLRIVAPGELSVIDRTLDDAKWIVAYDSPTAPGRFYLYDRAARSAKLLFSKYPALEGLTLAPMKPVVIDARDDLKMVSYLTLPVGRDLSAYVTAKSAPKVELSGENTPPPPTLPMVLFVHGGPWARDAWSYNPNHQWLANRGYAVLSVNYRGSTGFGKKFTNAGDLQWGARMHDDLIDAVKWAVDLGLADPSRIAIMGGSYGGYATLVGLTFTPETFACGVDIVGPSNLQTLFQNIPPYWQPMIEQFAKRMGDDRTEQGKTLLHDRSPLFKVSAIKRPLLIGQGANDPRVNRTESEQIVEAMQAKQIPVTYVVYANEGHGFAQPANRASFNAVAETFLAECLGGAYQAIGQDFRGSSIAIPVGAGIVPGVSPALEALAPATPPAATPPAATPASSETPAPKPTP